MTTDINHQNVGEWNKERIEALAKRCGKKVSELDVSDWASGSQKTLYCVSCLKDNLTSGNIVYTNNQADKIKCFKCQYK